MSTVAKPPIETTLLVRDSCLCLHVQRAARALARRFDDAFRQLNLTNGQFSLMMGLNRPEPAGMAAVAFATGNGSDHVDGRSQAVAAPRSGENQGGRGGSPQPPTAADAKGAKIARPRLSRLEEKPRSGGETAGSRQPERLRKNLRALS